MVLRDGDPALVQTEFAGSVVTEAIAEAEAMMESQPTRIESATVCSAFYNGTVA